GAERDAATHLLDKVARGEQPSLDIVSQLNLNAGEAEESTVFLKSGPLGSIFAGTERSIVGNDFYQSELEKDESALDLLTGPRAAQVVQDLQKAFEQDPTLRERLINPKTEEDQTLAKEFDVAARRSVSAEDYDAYLKPLLETGHLPIEKQTALSWSISDVNE